MIECTCMLACVAAAPKKYLGGQVRGPERKHWMHQTRCKNAKGTASSRRNIAERWHKGQELVDYHWLAHQVGSLVAAAVLLTAWAGRRCSASRSDLRATKAHGGPEGPSCLRCVTNVPCAYKGKRCQMSS